MYFRSLRPKYDQRVPHPLQVAKRMLKIITQCISDNQIGAMPRTFLAESTMLVKLIQAHLDTIDEGRLLVFLDLEKAFDRVSWDFMKKATVHFLSLGTDVLGTHR